ncbi:MAG: hypothetical protein A2X86_07110 [Bdellovibrionales bacterium GWA2_49_15]|nr:MAG: hypothetical protein A2X86_07110 [Bdellovibrionales bacterium GWA2_49_15]HAZ11955.1 hypothetical protein [Bdellovibrionales bacterium]
MLVWVLLMGVALATDAPIFSYETVMGRNMSVTTCPNSTARKGSNLYAPDIAEETSACGRIAPAPACDCEGVDAVTSSFNLHNHLQNTTQVWAGYVGAKTCQLLVTRTWELSAPNFKSMLDDPNTLAWGWPVLLKQYFNLYSSVEGKLAELPKFCEVQKELAASQALKSAMLRYFDSDAPLSEKIKNYGIFAHLFGESPTVKGKLREALIGLLKGPDNTNFSEKQKAVWYAFYHLDFTLGEYAKLAEPALGENNRTSLNSSSQDALKILKHLRLTEESKKGLQKIWLAIGDRELMDQKTLLDYIIILAPNDELIFPTINTFLGRMENGSSLKMHDLVSLLTFTGLKELSEDQWAQLISRSHNLLEKAEQTNDRKFWPRRFRENLFNTALEHHIPYEKISAMVNRESVKLEKNADEFMDKAKQIYRISGVPEAAKDNMSNLFITNYFERMLRDRKHKSRTEAFEFLQDKTLSKEGIRYLLSLYFNFDGFREIKSSTIRDSAPQRQYSEARASEFPMLRQLISNSKLSDEEKRTAGELVGN